MAQRIEKRHATQAQQEDLEQVQTHVDAPEPDHRVPVAGDEFFLGNHLSRSFN